MAKQLQEKENETQNTTKLLWDINDLVKETTFCKTWLEENLLNDPRIRRHQRQPHERGKRVWLAEETRQAIREIVRNEWV